MLIESYVGEKKVLVFDCESASSIEKGGLTGISGHPDRILPAMITTIGLVAEQMRQVMTGSGAPTSAEVEFGLKVDSGAVVSIARNVGDAHVVVRLRLG